MAKLTDRFYQEARTRINELNSKEILSAYKQVAPCDAVPEAVLSFMQSHEIPRVGKARLATFTYITSLENAVYYGNKKSDAIFMATTATTHDAFPTLFVYDPEWARDVGRRNILLTVKNRLKKGFDLSLPEEVESAICALQGVDAPPKNILFEGSEVRFANLRTSHQDNVVYGEVIVEHLLKGEKTWTIFVPEFNYREQFANRIANITNIPIRVAESISATWAHDTYVSVNHEVFRNALRYAASMAALSELSAGDTIQDLLQGEISVITQSRASNDGALYLDIDDELPSAVIIKGKLNIYLPAVLAENG